MYRPKYFSNDDKAVLKQVVADNGFATLITNDDDAGVPMVTHLPLQLCGDKLVGHMAKPNPHWKMFEGKIKSTAIFHGPHTYISPRWYVSDGQVPTWNYITVHITGTAHIIEDLQALKSILTNLSHQYEGSSENSWTPDTLDAQKLDVMAQGIVAFEMTDLDWIGKFKLGQNKKEEDKKSVLKEYQNSPRENDQALADWVEKL